MNTQQTTNIGGLRIAGNWGLIVMKFMTFLCAFTLGLVLAAPSANAGKLPDNFMPLSEIKTGMIGEARSVVQGFDPIAYKVEILGVEQGALPGSAMILARMEGPGLEKHGIVAGMSGSPVYIDGKIIGAIAYGWSFSYTPLAGITPIEHMLTMWDTLTPAPKPIKTASGKSGRGSNASTVSGWNWQPEWEAYLNNQGISKAEPLILNPTSSSIRDLIGEQPLRMEPLSTPLFVSTASPQTLARLDSFMNARGLTLFAAGSSAGSLEKPPTPSPAIVPGSSLGIPIMTGDLTITSMGTVTYCDEEKVLAFGHPMFFKGETNVPMSKAYIYGIMQSYQRSFKLGETREIVGAVRQDRQFGIGGVYGDAPERVEVSVTTGGNASYGPRTYNFSIWEDRDFLPQMAGTALMESINSAIAADGEVTADCDYTINLADGDKIQKDLRISSQGGASFPFFMSILQDMFLLLDNPYDQADVDRIDINVDVRPGFRIDSLMKVEPRYTKVRPGDTLALNSIWRPYRGVDYSKSISFKLPDDIKPGQYVLHVADASSAQRIDQRHSPSAFSPFDLRETIDLVKNLDYPQNRLRLYLFQPDDGLSIRNQSMEGLPGSIETLVSATAPTEMVTPITGRKIAIQDVEFEYPISARASFVIEVANYLSE